MSRVTIRPPTLFGPGRIQLPYRLSVEEVLEILLEKGGYTVFAPALVGVDLVIKKTHWTGLKLTVTPFESGTTLIFNPFAPTTLTRMLCKSLLPVLVLPSGAWKAFGQEFVSWLEQERPFGS